MPTAFNLVPPRFADGRHAAVARGLAAVGYDVINDRAARPTSAADVLVTWNLHLSGSEASAEAFRQAGARVIVCEEAYTRRIAVEKHFAMALDGHNGSGRWFPGGPERWARLGIRSKPWREDGRHILVCSQRGMGSALMGQPKNWSQDAIARLKRTTKRPIVHRPHPGKKFHEVENIESQLKDCWAVVIWASNCGIKALIEGVPVFYEAPHLVVSGACRAGIDAIEAPCLGYRLPAFQSMAFAQWTPKEIAKGDPFRHLLRPTR